MLRFRPLTGILFFNDLLSQCDTVSAFWGFRPLTGILFFNVIENGIVDTYREVCFRPLTGILFFNVALSFGGKWFGGVSVPLRGFCFSTYC